jgi:phosphosulfolactate synthase
MEKPGGQKRALHFIDIPERSKKPRRVGLTLARDLGVGYELAASYVEAVGEFMDYIKIRHLYTLLMTDSENDLTRRKIKLYRQHDIEVNPGGIVFEMAYLSRAVERTFETLARLGFTAVEISENMIPLTHEQKIEAIRQAKAQGLKVLFEVGEKYPSEALDVDFAARDMLGMIDVGCDLLILEKSQIELCLGQKGEKPQAALLVELAKRVGLEKIVFEAEATPHQVWLFKTFGPDVNMGPNIDMDQVIKFEPTRRTLSREGGYGYLSDRVAK